ncbi:MAG: tyrosine-type recombinase/integrase [Phycisphaerales bacterium]|nr:tyrosine-type recombinase/integrase [Phycisphaerales bacterium]
MASITSESNGRKTIQFVGSDDKRRSIRLGKVSMKQAEAVKVKVEDLEAAVLTGAALSRETAQWLTEVDDDLRDKLAAVGLVERRERATLAGFIDDYTSGRTDVKQSTRTVYARARRYLVEYFGESKPLRDITPGDADSWRLHLLDQGLAENTVRRSCGLAKQLFRAAIRRRLIQDNPFADLEVTVGSNKDRLYFVSLDESRKVFEACPDAEWRLIFGLARYGGLRIPSELMPLRWSDINWEKGCFTVTSPKTERHEGGESRIVPIFSELRPYLLEAFEKADEGAEFCISRYRNPTQNLRTELKRIIKRAGLKCWPKLWQNLRSTRETELADQFPVHVVTAWIGNSVQVAKKHYLQVTNEHFAKATRETEAVQNPVQQPAAATRSESRQSADELAQSAICGRELTVATACESDSQPKKVLSGPFPQIAGRCIEMQRLAHWRFPHHFRRCLVERALACSWRTSLVRADHQSAPKRIATAIQHPDRRPIPSMPRLV